MSKLNLDVVQNNSEYEKNNLKKNDFNKYLSIVYI